MKKTIHKYLVLLFCLFCLIVPAGCSNIDEIELIPVQKEKVEYAFRNENLLKSHYYKHGLDMGYTSMEEYEQGANDVINDSKTLHKTEKEDGDDVYYLESTNEFVVVSRDGYIRTYFKPDAGKSYYDRQ